MTAMSLSDALDAAIARENAMAETDPAGAERAAAAGETWGKWTQAETIVGDTAVVLPIAVAHELARALAGDPTIQLRVDVLRSMLSGHITRAESRAPKSHTIRVDVAYSGSGRDDDPWVATSWGTKKCTCDMPWRHGDDYIP